MADKVNVRKIERRRHLIERREVPLEPAVRPDEQKARARIERRVVRVIEADQVLDLLVGDHTADKQNVRPRIVELIGQEAVGAPIEVREARNDRQHRRPGEPQLFKILPVELRIAQRKVAALGVGLQLAPSPETLACKRAVHAHEIFGRRDVVVDEGHAIGQRKRSARRPGPERKVMQQQVIGMAHVDELPVIARQRLESMVGRLDENLGLVSGPSERTLDPEHLMADRVAIAQRGQYLVDADHEGLLARSPGPPSESGRSSRSRTRDGPVGSAATTSSAGGRF